MEAIGNSSRFQFNFGFLYRFSRVLVLVTMALVLAVIAPGFWRVSNAANVLRQASLLLFMAIGQTVVILSGGIDLSMGAVATFAGIAAASAFKAGVPLPLGIIGALLLGTLAGMGNGLMVAVVGLPPFMATYGTMWVATGLAVVLLRGYIIYGFEPALRFLGIGRILGIPVPVLIMILFWILTWLLLNRTTFGRTLYAAGANSEAARLSGISVRDTLLQAYTISGFYSGLTGVMFVALLNSAEAGLASRSLLPSIASVTIGGTSLSGGDGGIGGTVIGALIMTLIVNGMNILGASSNWQSVITGVVIVLAVMLDQWGGRALERREAGG